MDEKKDFLGTGWGFPPAFPKGINSIGVRMVSGEEDIKESLSIILSVQVGERILHPDFGADLNPFVFSSMSTPNKIRIKDLVFDAIYLFEPRIRPENVVVTDFNDGKVLIDVHYVVKATNSRHNIVFPFYIEEGTLI